MGDLVVGDWFGKAIVDARTTMLTEPFVHDFVRANIWHLKGREADLLVDTGMGICRLAPEIDTPYGKPLLVVATHIHLDHVGSLHEFPWRAGMPSPTLTCFTTSMARYQSCRRPAGMRPTIGSRRRR